MKSPDTVPIAITFADDTVCILRFVTCEYQGDDSERYTREPTPENIRAEITKTLPAFDADKKPLKGWRVIEEKDIPADREFRNALRDRGGKLEFDLSHARRIHLDRLRADRSLLLQAKDGEWMRAFGQGKKQEADRIESERQALRDLPDVEAATSIEALKALHLGAT